MPAQRSGGERRACRQRGSFGSRASGGGHSGATERLTEAADHWTGTGNRWYGAFAQSWQDSLRVNWQGAGAEAPRKRTYTDKAIVSELADQLHQAAKVAGAGASESYAARSRMR